jgi:thiol-disulfide isomerase/thioredoxin
MTTDLLRLALALLCLLPLVSAQAFSPEAHRGKVVVLDFWASWCTPCKQSFPFWNQMHARFADQGLVVIGVNVDEQRSRAEAFLKSTPASFQIQYDPKGELPLRYAVKAMPTSVVIDRKGQVVWTHAGFRASDAMLIEAKLKDVLQGKP